MADISIIAIKLSFNGEFYMKSWIKSFSAKGAMVNAMVMTALLSATDGYSEGIVAAIKTNIASGTVVNLLVSGAIFGAAFMAAIDLYNAVFAADGKIWSAVLKLLSWIVLAVYWPDLVQALMTATKFQ